MDDVTTNEGLNIGVPVKRALVPSLSRGRLSGLLTGLQQDSATVISLQCRQTMGQAWWGTPVIFAPRRLKHGEFKASLVYVRGVLHLFLLSPSCAPLSHQHTQLPFALFLSQVWLPAAATDSCDFKQRSATNLLSYHRDT